MSTKRGLNQGFSGAYFGAHVGLWGICLAVVWGSIRLAKLSTAKRYEVDILSQLSIQAGL